MYNYIEDKFFVKRMKNLCGDIMQDLCHKLKEEYDIGSNFYLVGSGAKNLILQNNSNPIDLDYNLEIVRCEDYEDCHYIKECTKKALNMVLKEYNLDDCQDSTSTLTTSRIYFKDMPKTKFSMDICIVCKDEDGYVHRLIHEKTGWTAWDRYYWNMAPNSKNVRKKVKIIKEKGKWQAVRNEYLNIKNKYLIINDYNHPSFICYIEAVNNVYNHINKR